MKKNMIFKASLYRLAILAGFSGLAFLLAACSGGSSPAQNQDAASMPARTSVAGVAGNVFDPGWAAADFTLDDQTGGKFSMSQTKGKVVVLSFIYTHCTDTCPFIGLKIRRAFDLLGADAAGVTSVAISTDPERDTVPVIAAYSKAMGVYDMWHFVTGTLGDMQKVWKDYNVSVTKYEATDTQESHITAGDVNLGPDAKEPGRPSYGLDDADLKTAGKIIGSFGGGYEVAHTAPFWLVDQSGKIRISLGPDATPEDIVKDIRVLLKS